LYRKKTINTAPEKWTLLVQFNWSNKGAWYGRQLKVVHTNYFLVTRWFPCIIYRTR